MNLGRKPSKVKIDKDALIERLQKSKITQSELARKCNYSRETINRALQSGTIDPILLENVCSILNVSVAYIKGTSRIKIKSLKSDSAELYRIFFETDSKGNIVFPYEFENNEMMELSINTLFLNWLDAYCKMKIEFDKEYSSEYIKIKNVMHRYNDIRISAVQKYVIEAIKLFMTKNPLSESDTFTIPVYSDFHKEEN